MSLKKSLFYLALVLLFTPLLGNAGCEQAVVNGSGETATWDMDYSDFNRLEINSAFDVTINQAETYLVRITIDKALYAYLKIDQRGDTLRIGLKSNYNYINMTPQAVIGLPDLHGLKLSDASKAAVKGFSVSHSLDFELTDASELELTDIMSGNSNFTLHDASHASGNIQMDDGNFNLSDASNLKLSGSGEDITMRGSSSSELELADFPVTTASVDLSSASHAIIKVSTRMDVKLSAASVLEYIGSPKLGKLEMSEGSQLNQIQP